MTNSHTHEHIFLSRMQIREVDRRAIDEYGMPGIVLMENAGRNAAELILDEYERLAGKSAGKVVIICGGGNNGGDGFVIARHLSNANVPVDLLLATDPARLAGDAQTSYVVAERMRIPMCDFSDAKAVEKHKERLREATIIVDALLGTGFQGAVRSPIDHAIRAINDARRFTVAIDVPSGLDCDDGSVADPTIRADMTITFVALKRGFAGATAKSYLGEIHVADIGAPRMLIESIIANGEHP